MATTKGKLQVKNLLNKSSVNDLITIKYGLINEIRSLIVLTAKDTWKLLSQETAQEFSVRVIFSTKFEWICRSKMDCLEVRL